MTTIEMFLLFTPATVFILATLFGAIGGGYRD